MTQPQYGYPPQQGYQPDPYAQQPQYGAPQGYGQQYPPQQPPPQYGYAPQYGQQYPPQPPPAPQGPPLPAASLEDFLNQPNIGGGKGISWKGVPDGYTVMGVVTRPITDGDVFVDTHPPTAGPLAGQVKTFKDGRPKQVMTVPLQLLRFDPAYPEGEARLFIRSGEIRDELSRAMAEAGSNQVIPEAGSFLAVTLTHRKPGNTMPTNMFRIIYRSPGAWEQDPAIQAMLNAPQQAPAPQQYGGAPQQAPYQQQAQQGYAPQPAQAYPNPQQYAQPVQPQYGGQAYNPNPQAQYDGATGSAEYGAPPAQQYGQVSQANVPGPSQGIPNPYAQPAVQQGAQAQPPAPQQPVQDQLPYGGTQQPQGQPQGQPQVQPGAQPSALTPEKQALLARMAGQQAGQPQQ